MRRSDAPSVLTAIALLVAVIGLAAVLSACGSDDGSGGGADANASLKLTVGDSVPLTGDLARFGLAGRKAADLAEDQIRKAIVEDGVSHAVTVVHEDDKGTPEAAEQAARKLVDGGATCLAGAWAPDDTIRTARDVAIRERCSRSRPRPPTTGSLPWRIPVC